MRLTTNERGFSLLEVLLSVVIISMLVGLSLPVYRSFQARNDLGLATQSVAEMLRRAQTYARGVNGDSAWSVRVQTGSAVLYKGAVYASRDATYDETVTLPATFTVSGLSDISFTKLAAVPSTTGAITLTNTAISESETVAINSKGMVSYYDGVVSN